MIDFSANYNAKLLLAMPASHFPVILNREVTLPIITSQLSRFQPHDVIINYPIPESGKQDVIMVDLATSMSAEGLSCPPPVFLSEQALLAMRNALTENGEYGWERGDKQGVRDRCAGFGRRKQALISN